MHLQVIEALTYISILFIYLTYNCTSEMRFQIKKQTKHTYFKHIPIKTMISRLKNLNNIKSKLRLAFLYIIILFLIGGGISYLMLDNVVRMANLNSVGQELSSAIMHARKAESDFMNFDSRTEALYEQQSSVNIEKFQMQMQLADSLLNLLSNNDNFKNVAAQNVLTQLNIIDANLVEYQNKFEQVVALQLKRGFKDYGLEGAIRAHVHQLQDCDAKPEQVLALTLRKHEKDYFIRKDLKYLDKLSQTAREIKACLRILIFCSLMASCTNNKAGSVLSTASFI